MNKLLVQIFFVVLLFAFYGCSKEEDHALIKSAATGDMKGCTESLKNGANINAKDNKVGLTPFMWACVKGNKDIAKLLLKNGANINERDKYGNNVLYDAASRQPQMFDFLLANGININARNRIGGSAIERATSYENHKLLKNLLKSGANVNVQRSNGGTPLISAVISEDLEAAKLLIEHGAKVNIIRNDGETALDFANEYGNKEIIKLLKSHGAKTGAELKAESKPSTEQKQPTAQ